jgi:hypothetical protein
VHYSGLGWAVCGHWVRYTGVHWVGYTVVHWVGYTVVHWVDANCDVCMLECEGGTSVGLPSLRSGRVFQIFLLTEARPLSERPGHMARSPVQSF